MRPWSSNRLIQAMVRRRKFIHMGIMNSTTRDGPSFIFRSAMNSAAGYPSTRQMMVHRKAIHRE